MAGRICIDAQYAITQVDCVDERTLRPPGSAPLRPALLDRRAARSPSPKRPQHQRRVGRPMTRSKQAPVRRVQLPEVQRLWLSDQRVRSTRGASTTNRQGRHSTTGLPIDRGKVAPLLTLRCARLLTRRSPHALASHGHPKAPTTGQHQLTASMPGRRTRSGTGRTLAPPRHGNEQRGCDKEQREHPSQDTALCGCSGLGWWHVEHSGHPA